MKSYEFQQQVVKEYRVEAESFEEALELLEENPENFLVDEYLSPIHDQENFIFEGETIPT